jgi:hypothetical protein
MQLTLYHYKYKQGLAPLLNYGQNINKGLQGIRTLMASSQKPIRCVVVNRLTQT